MSFKFVSRVRRQTVVLHAIENKAQRDRLLRAAVLIGELENRLLGGQERIHLDARDFRSDGSQRLELQQRKRLHDFVWSS